MTTSPEQEPQDSEIVYYPEYIDVEEVRLAYGSYNVYRQKEGRVLRQTVNQDGEILMSGLADTIYRATGNR